MPLTFEQLNSHAMFCYEAMERGSECLCGLINHDEEIRMYETDAKAHRKLVNAAIYPYSVPEDDSVPF